MTTGSSEKPRATANGATLVGLGAILLWSSLAVLTVSTGTMPAFELAACTFAIGGAAGLIAAALRGKLGALAQPWQVWLVGVGGLFFYHALYFAALRIAPPAEVGLFNYLWPLLIVLFSAALPGERLRLTHASAITQSAVLPGVRMNAHGRQNLSTIA